MPGLRAKQIDSTGLDMGVSRPRQGWRCSVAASCRRMVERAQGQKVGETSASSVKPQLPQSLLVASGVAVSPGRPEKAQIRTLEWVSESHDVTTDVQEPADRHKPKK